MTPAAEFNVYVDPEAAAAVFSSSWQVTMIGLDVTPMANATEEVLARVARVDGGLSGAVVGMLSFYRDRQLHEFGNSAPHVHDPVAVSRVTQPQLIEVSQAHVEVELAGALTRGMTVTDFRLRGGAKPNALVGTRLDAHGYWDLFLDAVERLARPRSDARPFSSP